MSDSLPSDARVFAVASGKGGVGKTTTAVNVGAALAESGAETVVVDADLGMANVADLLDLSIPGPTLQDVLTVDLAVEEATYRTHEGMAVVPGSTDLDSYGGIDPARLREVVSALREEFEYVILDTGAGLSHDTALPLGLVDTVVLVTTPQESAARDTGKTRELTERLDATVGDVVVTRVREEQSELGPDAVAELVGATVRAAIPEDDSVREALSAGQPLVTHAPESRVTTAYRRLAAALTGREMGKSVAESTGSAEPSESSDGEATSIEELLEREAGRSADVSALTGDSIPESNTDDELDESAADDQPAPDLEDDGDQFGDQPDDLGERDSTPTLDLEDDGESLDDDGEDGELPSDDDADAIAGTDGDILIAEEAPLDDDSQDDGEDAATESATDDGDDPMANIPRFDDADDAEFTRGSEASDPLAADPLAADPLGGDLADSPDLTDAGDEDETVGGHDEDESFGEDDGSNTSIADGMADENNVEDVDEAAGPRIEMDEEDDHGRSGLLGRLTGLFR